MEHLRMTMDKLEMSNYKQLYLTFSKLRCNLFGRYRLLYDYSTQQLGLNGGLYEIQSSRHRVVCQRIDCQGEKMKDEIFTFSYDKSTKGVVATNKTSGKQFVLEFGSQIKMNSIDDHIQTSTTTDRASVPSTFVLEPLPLLHQEIDANPTLLALGKDHVCELQMQQREKFQPPAASAVAQCAGCLQPEGTKETKSKQAMHNTISACLGLFTAQYGPHGTEMQHISLVSSNKPLNPPLVSEDHLHHGHHHHHGQQLLQLRAQKIVGDKNVPAGELTFIVDLTSPSLDVAQEVERDQRFIVTYAHDAAAPALLPLEHRVPNIAAWYRGRAQCNDVVGVWDPHWHGCSFVLYKEEEVKEVRTSGVQQHTGAGGERGRAPRFTLLLDDESDPYFRHGIDFHPLHL